MDIISFDIFDTCIARYCNMPEYVFDILARKVVDKPTKEKCADFVLLRKMASEQARRSSGKEDVTIEEIYSYCDFSNYTKISKDKILEEEIKIEENLYYPIRENLDNIQTLHKDGKRIVFISDMYLHSSFLISQLRKFGFWNDRDLIFVSGEIGKSKYSGNLFKYVQSVLDVDYSSWEHHGDNKVSDYKIPHKLGIKCYRYKKTISYYERKYIEEFCNPSFQYLSIISGISLGISNVMRDARYKLFASDLIAPLYVSFVDAVLNDAKRRKINKLYFLARDGLILYNIAQVLITRYPGVSVNYLYVSRNSLYLPGLDNIDINSIARILTPLDNKSLTDVCDRLKLKKNNYLNYSSLLGRELLEELFKNDLFIRELENAYKEQRKLLAAYLMQEGVSEGECALVDLIGSRKCQVSINNVLKMINGKSIFAYYYEVVEKRVLDGGEYYSYLFCEKNSQNRLFRSFDRAQNILEQYYSITPHSRTCGYEINNNRIVPVFEKDVMEKDIKEVIYECNKKACIIFAKQFIVNNLFLKTDSILEYSSTILAHFVNAPRKEYLNELECLKISDSQYDSSLYVGKFTFFDLFRKFHHSSRTMDLVYTYGNIFHFIFKYIRKI